MLCHAHKLLSVLLPLADYIKYMDDAELASVLSCVNDQEAAQEFEGRVAVFMP